MSKQRRFPMRSAVTILLLALLALVLGCDVDTPQNTFDPSGEVAQDQLDLLNLVLWPAAIIFILVEGLLIYALIRYRRKRDDDRPQQTHGNMRLEIAWTIAPAVLLLVLAVPMVALIVDLGEPPGEDALNVRVTGFQWNWRFEYIDPEFQDAEGNPLSIIGRCQTGVEVLEEATDCAQLHIPVGRQIGIFLEASDVVHSFWVPKLGGKLDAIPGRTNRLFLVASEPGSFAGQCAEFCGLGHADMRMIVVAQTEDEFQQWANEMLVAREMKSNEAGVAAYEE